MYSKNKKEKKKLKKMREKKELCKGGKSRHGICHINKDETSMNY